MLEAIRLQRFTPTRYIRGVTTCNVMSITQFVKICSMHASRHCVLHSPDRFFFSASCVSHADKACLHWTCNAHSIQINACVHTQCAFSWTGSKLVQSWTTSVGGLNPFKVYCIASCTRMRLKSRRHGSCTCDHEAHARLFINVWSSSVQLY